MARRVTYFDPFTKKYKTVERKSGESTIGAIKRSEGDTITTEISVSPTGKVEVQASTGTVKGSKGSRVKITKRDDKGRLITTDTGVIGRTPKEAVKTVTESQKQVAKKILRQPDKLTSEFTRSKLKQYENRINIPTSIDERQKLVKQILRFEAGDKTPELDFVKYKPIKQVIRTDYMPLKGKETIRIEEDIKRIPQSKKITFDDLATGKYQIKDIEKLARTFKGKLGNLALDAVTKFPAKAFETSDNLFKKVVDRNIKRYGVDKHYNIIKTALILSKGIKKDPVTGEKVLFLPSLKLAKDTTASDTVNFIGRYIKKVPTSVVGSGLSTVALATGLIVAGWAVSGALGLIAIEETKKLQKDPLGYITKMGNAVQILGRNYYRSTNKIGTDIENWLSLPLKERNRQIANGVVIGGTFVSKNVINAIRNPDLLAALTGEAITSVGISKALKSISSFYKSKKLFKAKSLEKKLIRKIRKLKKSVSKKATAEQLKSISTAITSKDIVQINKAIDKIIKRSRKELVKLQKLSPGSLETLKTVGRAAKISEKIKRKKMLADAVKSFKDRIKKELVKFSDKLKKVKPSLTNIQKRTLAKKLDDLVDSYQKLNPGSSNIPTKIVSINKKYSNLDRTLNKITKSITKKQLIPQAEKALKLKKIKEKIKTIDDFKKSESLRLNRLKRQFLGIKKVSDIDKDKLEKGIKSVENLLDGLSEKKSLTNQFSKVRARIKKIERFIDKRTKITKKQLLKRPVKINSGSKVIDREYNTVYGKIKIKDKSKAKFNSLNQKNQKKFIDMGKKVRKSQEDTGKLANQGQELLLKTKKVEKQAQKQKLSLKLKEKIKNQLQEIVRLEKKLGIESNLLKKSLSKTKLLSKAKLLSKLALSSVLLDKILQKQTQDQVLKEISKVDSKSLQKQKQLLELKQDLKQSQKQFQEVAQKLDQKQKQSLKLLVSLIQDYKLDQKQLLDQSVAQKLIKKPLLKQKVAKQIKKLKLPKIKELNLESKPPKGYNFKLAGFVKIGNKKVKIFDGLPPNRAFKTIFTTGNKKYRGVDKSTPRSFQLELVGLTRSKDITKAPGSGKVRRKLSRNKKVLNLVEKTKFAIDSKGEKKGLKIARKTKKRV